HQVCLIARQLDRNEIVDRLHRQLTHRGPSRPCHAYAGNTQFSVKSQFAALQPFLIHLCQDGPLESGYSMHAEAMNHGHEQDLVPRRKFNLNALLDYFIPVEMQVQPAAHRRARMFMLSHAFGPFLGNVIPLWLHFVLKIEMDYRFWIFFVSITIFWLYPIVLRLTKRYQLLAFLSIQNLTFC